MLVAPAFLLLIVLTTIILAVAVLSIIAKYERSIHQLREILKENMSLKTTTQTKTRKALEKVHKQTEEIIQQANKKAEEIIEDAGQFQNNEREIFLNKLKELTQMHSKALDDINENLHSEYKDSLTGEEAKAEKVFQSATKDIEDLADQELSQLKSLLEKETMERQKDLDEKIAKEYQALEKELSAYRQQKQQEIDQQLQSKLKEIIYATLGESLSPDQQEQLLVNSVKQAAKRISL